ncbi:MAG TPA: DUF6264 family protein [Terrimesophilobacter sp.]|nr:DUF6264 family protein [Terrimesophilobacter sp.]
MTVPNDAPGQEPRPRPEYGEYASPEEQEQAIARSQPREGSVVPDRQVQATPAATPVAPDHAPVRATPAPAGVGDRMVTVFLLALGLVYLIGGAGGYLSLGNTLDTVYAQFGLGDYTPTAATPAFGIAIVAGQAVIWIAAAAWSYRRLSSGRRSWWVPVLGAVATFLMTVVLFGVLLAGDPAFLAYVSEA